MRYLILVIVSLIFSFQLYALDAFTTFKHSTWDLERDNLKVRVVFDGSSATQWLYLKDEDGNTQLLDKTKADIVLIEESKDREGIHANQPILLGYKKEDLKNPVIVLFIANKNCLLLPDNEAPDGCLKRKPLAVFPE